MNKKSMLIPILLVLSVAFFVLIIYMKNKADHQPSPTTLEKTSEPIPQTKAPDTASPATSPDSIQTPETTALVEPTIERKEQFTVTEADMTPFLKSEIAEKWKKELGYTDSELVQAQREIRAEGYDETRANDPGIIMRHLPPRHMGRVTISSIDVTENATAGEPIPFTLYGTKPSPTYSFTHFDILIQGKTIRINAVGNSDGDNEAGLGGEVALDGTIDPLTPGVYRVVVPELGPKGYYRIIVR